MVGEVHEELVAPRVERREERAFVARLARESRAFPGPIDEMQAAQGGMPLQHFARVGIHERVDLDVWGAILQDLEHGRGEQHVAVVAQLRHQHAPDGYGVDRVGNQR